MRQAGVLALMAALVLAGCAGRTVLLRNAEGELARCEVSAGSAYLTGVIIRDLTLKQCVDEYKKVGFRPISG